MTSPQMSESFTKKFAVQAANTNNETRPESLKVTVMSFGYKEGPPPPANMVFDVRFLKNPYWVDELRPLTGRDKPVQDYVLGQPLAQDFLASLSTILSKVLPEFAELNLKEMTIAFGCTGGQHRSCALVEALSDRLSKNFPEYQIIREHRELEAKECR